MPWYARALPGKKNSLWALDNQDSHWRCGLARTYAERIPVCRLPSGPVRAGSCFPLAGGLYLRFLHVDRALWYNPYHDRNAHYLYSLKLAADVRNGRVLQPPPRHADSLQVGFLLQV
jgi:hypothetical protein